MPAKHNIYSTCE